MTAPDVLDLEVLQVLSPGLYPPPATPVALPTLPAPTDPYGRDLVCLDDLADDGGESDGIDQLAQDNYHRLNTPRSFLADYPNDGIDLTELLSKGATPTLLADLPRIVRAELLKDTRNEDARVTVTPETIDGVAGVRLKAACKPKVGASFEMTMTATAFATLLEKVRRT